MLFTPLLLLAASARAIMFTSPQNGSEFESGKAISVAWSSVSTDATSFTIAVQTSQPFETTEIAQNVQTSAGSYSWTPDAKFVGSNIKIRAVDPKAGILAESGSFDITQGTAAASSSGSASATGTGAAQAGAQTGAQTTAATGTGTGVLPPGVSASASTTPKSGAAALVPSLALVGGSLVALLL